MKRSGLANACYRLLLACIPASMLLVIWIPPDERNRLLERARGVYDFLVGHIFLFLPSWLQYTAVQTLVAAIVILGTAYFVSRKGWLRDLKPDRRHVFPALVIAYGAWAGLTYFWSDWPEGTLRYFLRELPFYALCVAAYALCARERRWRTVAVVFAVAAAAEAALQGLLVLRMAAVNDMPLGLAFQKHAIFYSNRNFGCAILLTGGFITLGFLARALRARAHAVGDERAAGARFGLLMAGGALALLVLGGMIVLAGALAGYVAAAVAGAAYLLCVLPVRRRGLIVATALALAVAAGATVMVSETLRTQTLRALLSPKRTTHLRVVDWLTTVDLYVQRPFGGWGMGTFPVTYARFHPMLARRLPFLAGVRSTHPHNEFARVASEQGMVGLLLYLGLLAYAFGVSHVTLRDRPPGVRLIGYALWAGALTFVVQGAFSKAPMNWSYATSFWLLVGVLASARNWPQEATPAEAEAEPARIGPAGWAVLALVVAAVGAYWWEWCVGGYASMVAYNQAHGAQLRLSNKDEAEENFVRFRDAIERGRPRCLWPDQILNTDYVVGWFLTRRGRWAEAAQQLEHVQRTAPEFMKTRLFLAECYLNLGQRQRAMVELREFMSRDPYDLGGYELLTSVSLREATRALEAHVYSRLTRPEHWIVEDHPAGSEVRGLLNFYAQGGRWNAARELVARVRRFMATQEVSRPYDVYQKVRALEESYREAGRSSLAQKLRANLPEAWAAQGAN